LQYKYEAFGERNSKEGLVQYLKKSRPKRLCKHFPYNASKENIEIWIAVFAALHDIEMNIS